MLEPSFEGALAFARDLIRIPSLSGAEEAVADRVLAEMNALGMDEVRRDEIGNVLGIVRGGGNAPPVLVNCHLDVVAEGDAEEWEFPPFGAEVYGGQLHGRGAMDIKGPLALQTHAAATLGASAPGDIYVVHTVFEERGGWGMHHLLRSEAVHPAAVIVGESTHGDITVGHRGRGEVEVVIRGRAGHASAPERATNPLRRLPAVLTAIEGLASDLDSDPVLGSSTLAITGVDVRPESRNVIPDEVVVVLDWRILPGDDKSRLLRRVEEAISSVEIESGEGEAIEVRMARQQQTSYTGLMEERDLFTPGFLMDSDHPIVRAASAAVGRRGQSGAADVRPWTFATDGGWSCGIFGIPTVGFAPGEERFAHTNRERLDLDEAKWAFERYPELIVAVQNAVVR